ncbi:hypothetical protein [Clostridium sp.]|jgi:hypothetical protein|uniref:hypothetical protein n=1 Tax=Clostridium sp. TaxID=1506 RepID=UPI0028470E46|nr:hypothetical protein [Clostridium sp.]MDR3593411.1 hypothetical protein [Clostridium sp.]
MSLNHSESNRNLVSGKRKDTSGGATENISEIGYPNNKDKGKGKKGGVVGKG